MLNRSILMLKNNRQALGNNGDSKTDTFFLFLQLASDASEAGNT
jgi:hypothetical protein